MSVPAFPTVPAGRVHCRVAGVAADGADGDLHPDWAAKAGQAVTIKPLLNPGLVFTGPDEPILVDLATVQGVVDADGYVVHATTLAPVYLVATDAAGLSVTGWLWEAEFPFSKLPTVRFPVASGSVVELTDFVLAPAVDETQSWVDQIPALIELLSGGGATGGGTGGGTIAQTGTLTLPASPADGQVVTAILGEGAVLPSGVTWDSGGAPSLTGRRLLITLVWTGADWIGTYSLPFAPYVGPDTTAPAWTATLTTGTPAASSVEVTASALATDASAITYRVSMDSGSTWNPITPVGLVFTLSPLTPETTYPAPRFRAVDSAGNTSAVLSAQGFTTAANSPSWAPTDVAGLAGWWDPSDTATVTVLEGSISGVADKSGNNRPLVSQDGVLKPTPGTLNGLPCLYFPNDRILRTSTDIAAGIALGSAHTVLAVIDVEGATKEGYILDGRTKMCLITGYSGNHFMLDQPYVVIAPTAPAGANLIGWRRNASTVEGRVNMVTGVNTATTTADDTLYAVGASKGSTGEGAMSGMLGKVGEILVYTTALSAGDLADAENYLKAKWGTP